MLALAFVDDCLSGLRDEDDCDNGCNEKRRVAQPNAAENTDTNISLNSGGRKRKKGEQPAANDCDEGYIGARGGNPLSHGIPTSLSSGRRQKAQTLKLIGIPVKHQQQKYWPTLAIDREANVKSAKMERVLDMM